MRQRFQEAEQTTTYRAPAPQTATAIVAPRTLTPVRYKPLRRASRERKRFKIGVPQVILGLVVFMFSPCLPANQRLLDSQNTPLNTTARAGTANAIYAEAAPLVLNQWLPRTKELDSELAKRSGRTPLPKFYSAMRGEATIEGARAYNQAAQPYLKLAQKAISLPYDPGVTLKDGSIFRPAYELSDICFREGVVQALAGKHEAASSAFLDALALGTQTNHLVRESALTKVLTALEPSIAHLSPAQAQQTAIRLEKLLGQRPRFAQEYAQENQRDLLYTEFCSYPRFLDFSENTQVVTRFPIFRILANYRLSHFRSLSERQLAVLQSSGPGTVEMLKATLVSGPLDRLFGNDNDFVSLRVTVREFETYTKNTERAAEVLALLKTRAGE